MARDSVASALALVREFFFRDRVARHDIPVLDGPLVPNDRLEASAVAAEVMAPDDVFPDDDGSLYVATGQEVVRLSGPRLGERETIARFPGPAGALAAAPAGGLLVCVGGVGLFRVSAPGRVDLVLDSVDGVPLRCLTAVATAGDGTVYLADGSTRHRPAEWPHDLMERNRLGRLVRFRTTDGATVLAGGLAWPSGLALEPDGDSLLVTQAWTHRLDRYRLGSNEGRDVAAVFDNHPGYPGRLAADPSGGFWLSVFALRTHLVEFVLTEDDYREEMMRTIDTRWWIRPALRTLDSGLEPLQGGSIRKLGMTKPWAPPRSYGLVVRLDDGGAAVESLHSRPGGRHHGAVSARPLDGRLFVACKGADRVVVHERSHS